jgi:hypothetical protein
VGRVINLQELIFLLWKWATAYLVAVGLIISVQIRSFIWLLDKAEDGEDPSI